MVPGYDSRQVRWEIEGLTKPDPKEQAAQIVAWAICWPWNVVWTLCVYNPFRYVGEFLLQELQSALFEISNGQFSEIERDLSVEPQRQPIEPEPAASSREPVRQTVEQSETHSNKNRIQPVTGSTDAVPQDQQASVKTAQQSVWTSPASDGATPPPTVHQRNGHQNGSGKALREKGTREDREDAYAWTPPVPSSHFSIAGKPLRAVKPGSSNGHADTASPTDSTVPQPEADPWLESHSSKS